MSIDISSTDSVIIKDSCVYKVIHIPDIFRQSLRYCANDLHISTPPPRNWKRIGANHTHANIAGINPCREIIRCSTLHSYSWNPVLTVSTNTAKSMSVVKMKYWKYSLGEFLYTVFSNDDCDASQILYTVICSIRDICDTLLTLGIVHGDLHYDNVLVNTHTEGTPVLSVIDWGWTLSEDFDMEHDEEVYFQHCLSSNFDFNHFLDSLLYLQYVDNRFVDYGSTFRTVIGNMRTALRV